LIATAFKFMELGKMITRLRLSLNSQEYNALEQVALAELRDPVDQIRYIVRQELTRRGLLPQPHQPTSEERHEPASEAQR
jgi:hypothetical protein